MAPTPTVWLIDDNQADLDLIALALESADVHCRAFRNPREAMDVLAGVAIHDLPDLLLLDVNMPGLDGIEVLRLIQSEPRLEDLRICIVTGVDMPLSHPLLSCLGAASVLRKPATAADLGRLRADVVTALAGRVLPARAMLKSC